MSKIMKLESAKKLLDLMDKKPNVSGPAIKTVVEDYIKVLSLCQSIVFEHDYGVNLEDEVRNLGELIYDS